MTEQPYDVKDPNYKRTKKVVMLTPAAVHDLVHDVADIEKQIRVELNNSTGKLFNLYLKAGDSDELRQAKTHTLRHIVNMEARLVGVHNLMDNVEKILNTSDWKTNMKARDNMEDLK